MQGESVYMHGITFGGHPVMSAIALKNIEIMKRDKIVEGVREHEDAFRSTLAQLLDLPIVGDLRGTGFFYALELVKDKETRETFSDEECEWLLRGFLSSALFERGLICRADDRGDPVIQISPPLVARQEQFDEMVGDPRRRARGGRHSHASVEGAGVRLPGAGPTPPALRNGAPAADPHPSVEWWSSTVNSVSCSGPGAFSRTFRCCHGVVTASASCSAPASTSRCAAASESTTSSASRIGGETPSAPTSTRSTSAVWSTDSSSSVACPASRIAPLPAGSAHSWITGSPSTSR